jgi:Leucine-rich repeat (LRR) protein
MCALVLVSLLSLGGAQDAPTDSDGAWWKAFGAIYQLGGKVRMDLDRDPTKLRLDVFLSGSRATDDDLKLVAALRDVSSLSLFNTKITGSGLAHLKGMDRLVAIDLSWPLPGYADAVGDTDHPRPLDARSLGHLRNIHGLRDLNLNYTRLDEAGLEQLGRLENLEDLDLSHVRISDEGLRRLRGLTHLTRLRLTSSLLTDRGMEALGQLESLRELSLRGTQIGDDGLRRLGRLKGLEELNLVNTRVTDAGLKHLRSLTGLRWVTLPQTGCTEKGIAELRRALPGAAVFRDVLVVPGN